MQIHPAMKKLHGTFQTENPCSVKHLSKFYIYLNTFVPSFSYPTSTYPTDNYTFGTNVGTTCKLKSHTVCLP